MVLAVRFLVMAADDSTACTDHCGLHGAMRMRTSQTRKTPAGRCVTRLYPAWSLWPSFQPDAVCILAHTRSMSMHGPTSAAQWLRHMSFQALGRAMGSMCQ